MESFVIDVSPLDLLGFIFFVGIALCAVLDIVTNGINDRSFHDE